MKKYLLSVFCVFLAVCTLFTACSSCTPTTTKRDSSFRVTAYITMDSILNFDSFQKEHINNVTDVILIGCANFDENGKISFNDGYDEAVTNLQKVLEISKDTRCYLSITGPGNQSDSDDWYKQMADQAKRHNKAFASGNLEESIKTALKDGKFDGVFFDYEYPIKKKYWKSFDKFIIKLDQYLGDEYKIGIAIGSWDLGQGKKAMKATDIVQIMSYDEWDEDGTHASVAKAEEDIKACLKHGYDPAQLELGLPFYARPTTHDSYWYGYNGYYEKLDDKGFCEDSETGLTFSFNTCDVIKEKTSIAIDMGLGGVMIWHWACDVPADNEKSLFKAINDAVDVANMKSTK